MKPRSRISALEAAFRSTLTGKITRPPRRTASSAAPATRLGIPISTRALAPVDSPNPFLLCNLLSPYGRVVPDIALQSFNYEVILDRNHFAVDSTGCATHVRLTLPRPSALFFPSSSTWLISNEQTAAAIFSLLNDYLISNNKRPLGFLNPWLYEPIVQALGFNDIISGHNPGCGTQGFYAVNGWDAVRTSFISSFSTLLILSPVGHRPRVAGLSNAAISA